MRSNRAGIESLFRGDTYIRTACKRYEGSRNTGDDARALWPLSWHHVLG